MALLAIFPSESAAGQIVLLVVLAVVGGIGFIAFLAATAVFRRLDMIASQGPYSRAALGGLAFGLVPIVATIIDAAKIELPHEDVCIWAALLLIACLSSLATFSRTIRQLKK